LLDFRAIEQKRNGFVIATDEQFGTNRADSQAGTHAQKDQSAHVREDLSAGTCPHNQNEEMFDGTWPNSN
jgi:hypothetical protein